jgi:hypothetical protein
MDFSLYGNCKKELNWPVSARDEQIEAFGKLDGVVRAVHDFSEIKVAEFFD